MAGDRAQELVALEGAEADLGLRGDRRGAGHVAEQRDLPEVVARAHRPDVFPVRGNVNLTRLDDVEAVAVVSLADDLGSRVRVDVDQVQRKLVDRRRRERLEERHRPQQRDLLRRARATSASRAVIRRQVRPALTRQQRAREDERPADADGVDHQRGEDRAEPDGPDEDALDHAENARQHLVGHGALQERQGGDVDDRVPDADDREQDQRDRRLREDADQRDRESPEDQAEPEVGGQSLPADESERRDRAEQAADPDRRVQEARLPPARGRAARARRRRSGR